MSIQVPWEKYRLKHLHIIEKSQRHT